MEESAKLALQSAVRSLARCEQCRFSLERKLEKKEFSPEDIKEALDYLEANNYLSDERYAETWVRSHCAFKPMGAMRLIRELRMKGLSNEIAKRTVAAFFETVDESVLCRQAYQKLSRKLKNEQKIIKSLADSGFSYKMIQSVLREEKVR